MEGAQAAEYVISALLDRTCQDNTVCEGDEYETSTPSATSDRTCLSHTTCAACTCSR